MPCDSVLTSTSASTFWDGSTGSRSSQDSLQRQAAEGDKDEEQRIERQSSSHGSKSTRESTPQMIPQTLYSVGSASSHQAHRMHSHHSEERSQSLETDLAKGNDVSVPELQDDIVVQRLESGPGAAVAPSHHPPPVCIATIKSEPQQKTVSLFASNYCGFLPAAAQEPAERVSAWLAAELTHCAGHVAAQRGVVQLISADHTFASFGAVRSIGAHRQAAVRAATGVTRREEPIESAVGDAVGAHALGTLANSPVIREPRKVYLQVGFVVSRCKVGQEPSATFQVPTALAAKLAAKMALAAKSGATMALAAKMALAAQSGGINCAAATVLQFQFQLLPGLPGTAAGSITVQFSSVSVVARISGNSRRHQWR
eukprot:gene17566-biopygen13250